MVKHSAKLDLLVGALMLGGASTAAMADPVLPHADAASVTKGQVTLNTGKTLHYTATAAQYPIYVNDTGELMATMFFVAYIADRAPGDPPRPLTFMWNGGPGSSSSQVHVVGFGPKHVKSPDIYPDWKPGLETPIVDNPETWLAASDLVFVDPPGTGYSRATSKEYRDVLYTTRGDAEAVAELVRVYLTRNHRWNSPLFIAGESYGTTRAMAVADALEYRRTHLDGVMLISGGYETGQRVPRELSTALGISHTAATGYYHKLLAPEVQALSRDEAVKQAVDWARRVYAPALAHRDTLSAADKAAVIDGLHKYTGIDPKYVNEQTLAVTDYDDNLLRAKGLELGRYDSRMTVKYRGDGVQWLPTGDPSLIPMIDIMEGTSRVFNDYMHDTLKFESDLLYRGPWGKAFHPEPLELNAGGLAADWMARMFVMGDYNISPAEAQARRNGGGEAEAAPAAAAQGGRGGAGGRGGGAAGGQQQQQIPALRRAMDMNPNLHVENIVGMYDGSCAAKDEAVAASDPEIKARVIDRCYVGGHMWYSDKDTRVQAQRDFAEFVHDSSAHTGH